MPIRAQPEQRKGFECMILRHVPYRGIFIFVFLLEMLDRHVFLMYTYNTD